MIELLRSLVFLIRPSLTRRFLHGYIYNFFCDVFPLKESCVFLESHHGKAFGGNPFYIANFLVSRPEYRGLNLVVVGPAKRSAWLKDKLGAKNIKVVSPRSVSYVYYLATCKWLISDVTFPLYFSRRDGQCYLNTWHGTPFKVLGRYTPGELFSQFVNSQRNFFHANYLLVPNRHFERVFFDSYGLVGSAESKALRVGYCRNDPLVNSKLAHGESVHVAFMPTWRGGIVDRRDSSAEQIQELVALFDFLDSHLPSSVVFWVKLHPLVEGCVDLSPYSSIFSFPQSEETYQFLAGCDALVTDYSSVFFDFASTKRPIVRYVHDEISYAEGRGFCLPPSSLPFPCARTPSELLFLLERLVDGGVVFDSAYKTFFDDYCELDSGDSSKRVCDFLFKDSPGEKLVLSAGAANLCRVAIYLNEGFFESVRWFDFIESLDLSRYSFTFFISSANISSELEQLLLTLPRGINYVVLRFNAYFSPVSLISFLLFGFWVDVRKLTAWTKTARREYSRLTGDLVLHEFVTFADDEAGSRLIESGHDWGRVMHLSCPHFQQSSPVALSGFERYYKKCSF